jgi:hypothetical protein
MEERKHGVFYAVMRRRRRRRGPFGHPLLPNLCRNFKDVGCKWTHDLFCSQCLPRALWFRPSKIFGQVSKFMGISVLVLLFLFLLFFFTNELTKFPLLAKQEEGRLLLLLQLLLLLSQMSSQKFFFLQTKSFAHLTRFLLCRCQSVAARNGFSYFMDYHYHASVDPTSFMSFEHYRVYYLAIITLPSYIGRSH